MKITSLSPHLHPAPLMKKYHSASEVTRKPQDDHWGLIDLHTYLWVPLCSLLLGISLSFFSGRVLRIKWGQILLQCSCPCLVLWLLASGVSENKGAVEKNLASAHAAITWGSDREAPISWLANTLLVAAELLPEQELRSWGRAPGGSKVFHSSPFYLAITWTRRPGTRKDDSQLYSQHLGHGAQSAQWPVLSLSAFPATQATLQQHFKVRKRHEINNSSCSSVKSPQD